jgi:hypothetical protein
MVAIDMGIDGSVRPGENIKRRQQYYRWDHDQHAPQPLPTDSRLASAWVYSCGLGRVCTDDGAESETEGGKGRENLASHAD